MAEAKTEAKRQLAREARRTEKILKECKKLALNDTNVTVDKVANLMAACNKLVQNDENFIDCLESGLIDNVDIPSVNTHISDAITDLNGEATEDEWEKICKEVLEIHFPDSDNKLNATIAMTGMEPRKRGETLSAFHLRFTMLSRARKWVHDLYADDSYEAESVANRKLWLAKVSCQGIQQSLLSLAATPSCTVAKLLSAAETLIRNGTELDSKIEQPEKQLDLNLIRAEMSRHNLEAQQQMRAQMRSLRDDIFDKRNTEDLNFVAPARRGERIMKCDHCAKDRPHCARTHTTAECRFQRDRMQTRRDENPMPKRQREKYCSFHNTNSHSDAECHAQNKSRNTKQQRFRYDRTDVKPKRGNYTRDKSNITCYNCNQKGHYASECPRALKRPEASKTKSGAEEQQNLTSIINELKQQNAESTNMLGQVFKSLEDVLKNDKPANAAGSTV